MCGLQDASWGILGIAKFEKKTPPDLEHIISAQTEHVVTLLH